MNYYHIMDIALNRYDYVQPICELIIHRMYENLNDMDRMFLSIVPKS